MGISDKLLGCFMGAVIGDAIGTTVEFQQRGTFKPVEGIEGGGVFSLPPGLLMPHDFARLALFADWGEK